MAEKKISGPGEFSIINESSDAFSSNASSSCSSAPHPASSVMSLPSVSILSTPYVTLSSSNETTPTNTTWSVGHQIPLLESCGGVLGDKEEVRMGVSRKGHPKLFIGSYSYVQLHSGRQAPSEANAWRCYKMHCRGRVVKVDEGSFTLRQAHTCDTEEFSVTGH